MMEINWVLWRDILIFVYLYSVAYVLSQYMKKMMHMEKAFMVHQQASDKAIEFILNAMKAEIEERTTKADPEQWEQWDE